MASDLLETTSSKTGDDLLEFWEDPSNAELIKNAVSLESLERSINLKDLIRDHFEDVEDEAIYNFLEEYFPKRHPVKETEVTSEICFKPTQSWPGMSSFEEFQKFMAEKSEEAQALEQSDTQDHTTVQGLASKELLTMIGEDVASKVHSQTELTSLVQGQHSEKILMLGKEKSAKEVMPVVGEEESAKLTNHVQEQDSEEVSMQEVKVVEEESAKEVIPVKSTSPSDASDVSLGLVVTELLKISNYASKENVVVGSYKTTKLEGAMHQSQDGTQNVTLKASSTIISTDNFEDEENVQKYNQEIFFDGKRETRKKSFNITFDPKEVGRDVVKRREGGGTRREEDGAGREEGGAGREEGETGREEGGAGIGEDGIEEDEERVSVGEDDILPSSFFVVQKKVLGEAPYNCVGRLFWRNKTDIIYGVTAFYAGHERIITVAHAFDPLTGLLSKVLNRGPSWLAKYSRRSPSEACFVPAMEDKDDIHGKRYGFYEIKDLKILEGYRPRQNKEDETFSSCYDVCSAKICKGRKKEGKTFVNVDLNINPLPICPFDEESCQIQWTIIGYGEHRLNSNQRMLRGTGIQTEPEPGIQTESVPGIETEDVDRQVIVEVAASAPLPGMSGGPWIRDGEVTSVATGVQSGQSKPNKESRSGASGNNQIKFARSPFLTLTMLRDLGVQGCRETN